MEMLINREFPKRPEKNKLDELKSIGSATISAELKHLAGIEDSFMLGPKTCNPGQSIAGPAITLQFMPIREEYYKDEAEPKRRGTTPSTCFVPSRIWRYHCC